MTDILQIFKNAIQISKQDYNTESRSKFDEWKTVESKSGYLIEDKLVLPIEHKENSILRNADLIILQDIKDFDIFLARNMYLKSNLSDWYMNSRIEHFLYSNQQIQGFSILSKPWTFELFEFQKVNDVIEIYLNITESIGVPKRSYHKIAELSVGKSICYRLNSKDDFTLTGGQQRVFNEFDFVFQYKGMADKFTYMDLNKICITKIIPRMESKLIDERKILK